MRIFLFCVFFSWMALFGGIGCKKSSTNGEASARTTINSRFADQMSKTIKRAARPAPAPALPAPPSYATRKAKKLPAKLQQEIAGIGQTLKRVQSVYAKAFAKGKIKRWRAYYKAESLLNAAKKRFRKIHKQLRSLDPMVAEQMSQAFVALKKLISAKASPQVTGQFAYAILEAAYHAGPSQKNALLSSYRATIKNIEQAIVAEKSMGQYRAGLILMAPQTFTRLNRVNKRDIRTAERPPKGTAHTIGVFLRDVRTGTPLAGTEVSMEIIGAKNKRQYSTQRLFLLWDGAPKYVGHLRLPPKDQQVIVQVTIAAFPMSRTQYSQKMLRNRRTIRFAGLVKRGQLSFAKRKPVARSTQGPDLMRAVSLVGGQTMEAGPYRVGMALAPLQTLYTWKNGTMTRMWRSRRATSQLVVFVQDKRSGLLIPNARLEAFVYYKDSKGNLYRNREYLKPVYDGFHSYRVHLTVRPGTYDVRLRLDPPLLSRFGSFPATRAITFNDIKHFSLLKGLYKRR